MTIYCNIQLFRRMNSIVVILKKIPFCMKLSVVLLFIGIALAKAAPGYSQTALLTLNAENRTVQEVLDEIEKQSDFHFFYNNKQVNTARIVTLRSNRKNVFNVLEQLFAGTGITYKILDKSIILSPADVLEAQQQAKEITGVVKDAKGEPVIGANVVEKGTANGTITDLDGRFRLTVPGQSVLVVSYIGYIKKEVPVGRQTAFSIELAEDTKNLDEIIVTALGIKREEKALGYAVQKVSGEGLTSSKSIDLATSLTGKVAGLNIQNSTEFNETPKIRLRGEEPLLIIDGVPYANMTLNEVASDDIESIDVLKGATASALYGARGSRGGDYGHHEKGLAERRIEYQYQQQHDVLYRLPGVSGSAIGLQPRFRR